MLDYITQASSIVLSSLDELLDFSPNIAENSGNAPTMVSLITSSPTPISKHTTSPVSETRDLELGPIPRKSPSSPLWLGRWLVQRVQKAVFHKLWNIIPLMVVEEIGMSRLLVLHVAENSPAYVSPFTPCLRRNKIPYECICCCLIAGRYTIYMVFREDRQGRFGKLHDQLVANGVYWPWKPYKADFSIVPRFVSMASIVWWW